MITLILALALALALALSLTLASPHPHARFNDGECSIQIMENVRGADVFIVQPTSPPVNDNLMELLLMIRSVEVEVEAATTN